MTKRNIKLGVISMFLVGATFTLAGCGKNEEQKNTQENQEQSQAKNQSQTQDQNQVRATRGEGAPAGPPVELTSTCADKVEGDVCEATFPRKIKDDSEEEKTTGTCQKMGDSETLICRPANMPEGQRRGGVGPAGEVPTSE